MKFSELVWSELQIARSKHGPIRSKHEGLAVIEEEFLELREQVFFARNPRELLHELIQLGAMCERMAHDLNLVVEENFKGLLSDAKGRG